MKSLLLFLLSLLIIPSVFANQIDELKTDNDVAKFITSLDKKFHKKGNPVFVVKSSEDIIKDLSCDSGIKKSEIKNWEKLDFNNDGRTDLLVIGYWKDYGAYVAIDMGNNKFKLISLYYSPFGNCAFATVCKTGPLPMLLFHSSKVEDNPNEKSIYMLNEVLTSDTLIYKFGDFVEFNNNPSVYKIDSIKFETGRCFGTCPVFSIGIDRFGRATYTAGIYSAEQGVFKTKIRENAWKEINDVVNYISVKKLKNNYQVNWTDDATCWLTIKFSDGSVKRIKDYGELGSFGLRKIYSLFEQLRDSQDWVQN